MSSFVPSMSPVRVVDYYGTLLSKGGKQNGQIKVAIDALEEELNYFSLAHPKKASKTVSELMFRAALCNDVEWAYAMAFTAAQMMCWIAASGQTKVAVHCEWMIRNQVAQCGDERRQRHLREGVCGALAVVRMGMDSILVMKYGRAGRRPSLAWFDYFRTVLIRVSHYEM